MPSFGEKLKLEREKRAVTLEQISLSTKIGTRMLQALEDNKFSQLPGGIFNKGFVRAYARCVGIDEDQAVADYLVAAGETAPVRLEATAETYDNPVVEEENAPGPSRDLPWGLFAAALLVVALGLSIWSYRKREHREQQAAMHPPAPVAVQAPAVATASAAKPETALPVGGVTQVSSSQSNPVAPTNVVNRVSLPTSAPAVAGGFSVVVQARENSWVTITVDGKTAVSDLLLAGSQHAVRGHQEVVVKAGNIGGLDFQFNGKKLTSQGGSGEVKTLTFGSTGLQSKEPNPPATQ